MCYDLPRAQLRSWFFYTRRHPAINWEVCHASHINMLQFITRDVMSMQPVWSDSREYREDYCQNRYLNINLDINY